MSEMPTQPASVTNDLRRHASRSLFASIRIAERQHLQTQRHSFARISETAISSTSGRIMSS